MRNWISIDAVLSISSDVVLEAASHDHKVDGK